MLMHDHETHHQLLSAQFAVVSKQLEFVAEKPCVGRNLEIRVPLLENFPRVRGCEFLLIRHQIQRQFTGCDRAFV